MSTGSISLSEWTHIALVVEYDTTTTISFYRDGSAFGSYIGLSTLILDNSAFDHYIGGIRHNMRLYDAFRGFMYECHISQTAKTDFTDNHTGTCTGDCTSCPVAGTCLSTCAYNQTVDPSDGSCTTCTTSTYCNICDAVCEPCTGYVTTSCT